jgi:hypothetical protein
MNKTEEEFVDIMNGHDLPYPRKIDFTVPDNELCRKYPNGIPKEYREPYELTTSTADWVRVVRFYDQG